jgi:hypothetical protein
LPEVISGTEMGDPRKRDITECDSWAEFALYSAARDKHSWTMTNAEGCQAVAAARVIGIIDSKL